MIDYAPRPQMTFREAVAHPNFVYARTRRTGGDAGPMYTIAYHRDRTAPRGVMFAAMEKPEIADPIIRELRNNSPLSPTEGA